MNQQKRQLLHATLNRSSLADIQKFWSGQPDDFDYVVLRPADTGMVMTVGRTEGTGEPFNLGEVTVTRCALRLDSGETGIAYVVGSDKQQALYIAILDALCQNQDHTDRLFQQVIYPLNQRLKNKHKMQRDKTAETRVDFMTMVRGEK